MQSHKILTYTLSAAAAKGQVVVHLGDLIGYGAVHRKPVWVKRIGIAPVSRIPAPITQPPVTKLPRPSISMHCRRSMPFSVRARILLQSRKRQ